MPASSAAATNSDAHFARNSEFAAAVPISIGEENMPTQALVRMFTALVKVRYGTLVVVNTSWSQHRSNVVHCERNQHLAEKLSSAAVGIAITNAFDFVVEWNMEWCEGAHFAANLA